MLPFTKSRILRRFFQQLPRWVTGARDKKKPQQKTVSRPRTDFLIPPPFFNMKMALELKITNMLACQNAKYSTQCKLEMEK